MHIAYKKCNKNGSENFVDLMRDIVGGLPQENRKVLSYACDFFCKMIADEDGDKDLGEQVYGYLARLVHTCFMNPPDFDDEFEELGHLNDMLFCSV